MAQEEEQIVIEGRKVTDMDIYSPVTYVPRHAAGNAGHKDCKLGVIITIQEFSGTLGVLYFPERTIQRTNAEYLVWG